ncbi:unnamed protein product [Hymenolepis diminuta]|nr:unnamed protein product [Hymenolepis diminuta]
MSKDSSNCKKVSCKKEKEVSCHLSASPDGLLQLKNTGNKRGWALEVTQDIAVGDVLMVDKPYASNLLSDHFGTHCYHCYKRMLSLIPCDCCPYVGFCSEFCAENAKKHVLPASAKGAGRHVYDCHGILACIMLDNYAGWSKENKDSIGGPIVARLAFACVANTDPDTLLDYICSSGRYAEEGRGHQAFEGATKVREKPPSVLDPTDYSAAAWLVACSEHRNRADLWQRTVAAVFLTYCLSLGGYPMDWFDETPDFYIAPSPTNRPKRLPASWVAACILYHLQSVSANGHSYSEEVFVSFDNLSAVKSEHIVSCLYPTLSLVNHSCDPTTFRVCTGGGVSCFLAALRPLPAGSEIFDCYSDCFSVASKVTRQKELTSHYLFQCVCKACTEDWPRFLDIRLEAMRALKCPQCKGMITLPARRCPHCKSPKAPVLYERLTNVTLPKQFELVERGVVNEGSVEAAKKLLEDMNTLIERPNMLYDRAQEMFKMTIDFTRGAWVFEPWA